MKLATNDDCCACSFCYRACAADAPYFDGEKVQIDNEKCISCGKCISACPMGAIYDTENPPTPAAKHDPLKLECDALIIGAGGAGMIAAVRLAEETGKKVIVLEKAKRTGAGAIHVAGPLQFFDTKWALDAGAEPTVEKRVQATLKQSGGAHNPKLIENTVRAMPRFFDWLCGFSNAEEKFELKEQRGGLGGPPPMGDESPAGDSSPLDLDGSPEAGAPPMEMQGDAAQSSDFIMAGGGMAASGMAGGNGQTANLVVDTKSLNPPSPAFHNAGEFIMDNLFKCAKELGVTILNETPAVDFILDDEGNVIGVKAEDPGGEVNVYCKACLITTGSLLLSDLLKRIEPDYVDAYMPRFAHAINTYTGDGALMCERAGIPVDYDNIWLNITGSLVMPCDALTVEYSEASGKRPLITTDLRPHAGRAEALNINISGERYQNEQYSNITVKNQIKQPQCLSYTIMDEKTIKMQPLKHKKVFDLGGKPLREMVPVTMKVDWNEENMQWWASLKNRHLIIADTIEEMAEKLLMPVETVKTTVARYNELCEKGVDEDYGKDPDYMLPIKEGRLFAIKTFLMSDGVEGGIFIDENCQVIGKDGLMKGLYAAGDNSSGNIVKKGDGKTGITNEYGWALCSGMISADSMIRQLA